MTRMAVPDVLHVLTTELGDVTAADVDPDDRVTEQVVWERLVQRLRARIGEVAEHDPVAALVLLAVLTRWIASHG
jgi:hypothetical protein